jgi:soluble lytic murein transglycosylase
MFPDLAVLRVMNQILKASRIISLIVAIAPHISWAKSAVHDHSVSALSQSEDETPSLSEQQRELRLQHAHELLGRYYKTSAVRAGESVSKINSKIYAWTRERLPKKFKSQYQKIAQAIIDESLKHQFDPVFVLSVIQNESSFNPHRLGALDEIGLMQLRPGTAKWIARKFDLKYKGHRTLHDPVENIRLGTAYMDYLRGRFSSHAQLYLSAYNMGKRNVDENLEKDIWPKDYASHVMHYYIEFYSNLKASQKKKYAAL